MKHANIVLYYSKYIIKSKTIPVYAGIVLYREIKGTGTLILLIDLNILVQKFTASMC